MWQTYFQPSGVEEALELLQEYAGKARIIAGGTDVLVELQRGVRPTTTLIDITALRDLSYIREENGFILLGALTYPFRCTHYPQRRDRIYGLCAACSAISPSLLGGRRTTDPQSCDHRR